MKAHWLAALVLTATAAAQDVEPGFVKGKVVDRTGRPLAGAVVLIDPMYGDAVTLTTGADGAYRLRLPPGAFKVSAQALPKYAGKTYRLDLHPSTTDGFASEDGAVRDFEWRLSGERPPGQLGTYGGLIYLSFDPGGETVIDTQNVTVTLAPQGPLIDGHPGETLTLKGGEPRTEGYGKLLDVPIGTYEISAVYAPPGAPARKLGIALEYGQPYAETVIAPLAPEGMYCTNCLTLHLSLGGG